MRCTVQVVMVLKKEMMKTQNKDLEKGAEYRQLLVQAIHTCAVRFPDVAGEGTALEEKRRLQHGIGARCKCSRSRLVVGRCFCIFGGTTAWPAGCFAPLRPSLPILLWDRMSGTAVSKQQVWPAKGQGLHAGSVLHLLMDFLSDSNTASALDVIFFIREIVEVGGFEG